MRRLLGRFIGPRLTIDLSLTEVVFRYDTGRAALAPAVRVDKTTGKFHAVGADALGWPDGRLVEFFAQRRAPDGVWEHQAAFRQFLRYGMRLAEQNLPLLLIAAPRVTVHGVETLRPLFGSGAQPLLASSLLEAGAASVTFASTLATPSGRRSPAVPDPGERHLERLHDDSSIDALRRRHLEAAAPASPPWQTEMVRQFAIVVVPVALWLLVTGPAERRVLAAIVLLRYAREGIRWSRERQARRSAHAPVA